MPTVTTCDPLSGITWGRFGGITSEVVSEALETARRDAIRGPRRARSGGLAACLDGVLWRAQGANMSACQRQEQAEENRAFVMKCDVPAEPAETPGP